MTALFTLSGLAACTNDGSEGSGSDPENGDTPATEVIGSGDTYEATIRRTTDGVPHITGATLADAAFGQGYASGEDRTCDLADQVVKIRGERARWHGAGEEDANLSSDVQWRAIGIYERAQEDWDELPEEAQALFDAYASGWNAHLDEVTVEGIAGWCKGERWVAPLESSEVYAYARAIALNASGTRVGAFIASAAPPAAGGDTGADGSGPPSARAPGDPEAAGAAGSGGVTAAPSGQIGGLADAPIASNGWAIGADRSTEGGGMLVANPHFPWEGELRFWEVHLTVPGEIDVYGAQLSGVPGLGIGFNEAFGWTHTVSAGNRFTAYQLDLVPGSPTTYVYGDEEREMTSETYDLEVLGSNGEPETVERTAWFSHYGPIIDFPGFGWSDTGTITYRDANIDNDEFVLQYFAMLEAKTFDDFKAAHADINGVPLFNTVATSAEGEAWYADTSATPNLSDEAIAAYEQAKATDPITKIAADNGAILLDGSDPLYEWVEEEGARDPGLVPAVDQPQVSRDDYLFNANDSFWMPHATEMLEGDYSPLHGRQETPRSPRTRENATVLDDATAEGASGADGSFTLEELADASLANVGYTARVLREDVAERCAASSNGVVNVVPLDDTEDELAGLPGGAVDISAACEVLAAWDGVYDLDRAGPPLWREFLGRFAPADQSDAGPLWADAFDPTDPLGTPSGLAPGPGPDEDGTDLVRQNLAYAVQSLDAAGFEPDVTLGETQFALRNGERIPIHGGSGTDGTTNVVGFGSGASILDPALTELKREPIVEGSQLATTDGETGYLINNGTSFLMALAFTPDGPQAQVFLNYSNTEDRASEDYVAATQRFSEKNWRTVAFTEDAVAKDTRSAITVKR